MSGRSFVYNLRFPGQYYDSETGLNYNMERDYDSSTGRYIQSDPIGLAGGSYSTYAYTNGDPINAIDPRGLAPPGRAQPGSGFPSLFPPGPFDEPWNRSRDNAALGIEDWLRRVGNAIGQMCREAFDKCLDRYDKEEARCERWRGMGPVGDRDRWYRACLSRAANRRNLCYTNKGEPDPDEPPEWSQDDIPKDVPGKRK